MRTLYNIIYFSTISALLLSACSEDTGTGGNNRGDPDDTPEYTIGTLVPVKVLDYSPAPGQFVNEIPEYEAGDTKATIIAKAEDYLNNKNMISLGAWGGNITLKLSTPIINKKEANDFRIIGNAIYANASTSGVRYGSAEPGIVLVMQDSNSNGLADDTWYELYGAETFNGQENYSVTYHYPEADATNDNFIYWESNTGESGYISRNTSYHNHNLFPLWLENSETMTFSGRRLPDNGKFNATTSQYDLTSYYGYADSHPNNTDYSCFDIDNAIDADGNYASLSSIDFIKIYTGVLQSNGPLGECSTEVAGIETLND